MSNERMELNFFVLKKSTFVSVDFMKIPGRGGSTLIKLLTRPSETNGNLMSRKSVSYSMKVGRHECRLCFCNFTAIREGLLVYF